MGVTLRHNSFGLKRDSHYSFDPESGYFGDHTSGSRHDVRTILTEGDPKDEARKMFAQLARGANIVERIPGRLWISTLDDGTQLSLRIDYPPGHQPAVWIGVSGSADPAGIKTQKIHFAKR